MIVKLFTLVIIALTLFVQFICGYVAQVIQQESRAIAKMTARCAYRSKKQPHLHLRSRDFWLTQFNRTLWT